MLAVRQGGSSNFTSHNIALGAALARNEIAVVLDGEGSECTLNGLYVTTGRQHVDNYTTLDHAKPHSTSHELYKGILDGKSQGVFHGRIIVRQDAQKTDAIQRNKNLLLSEGAVINTKPQLEIYADDVKCTHGATVGQVDPDAVFYLRSRGIALREARALLTYAFTADVLDRIKIEPLRARSRRGAVPTPGRNREQPAMSTKLNDRMPSSPRFRQGPVSSMYGAFGRISRFSGSMPTGNRWCIWTMPRLRRSLRR